MRQPRAGFKPSHPSWNSWLPRTSIITPDFDEIESAEKQLTEEIRHGHSLQVQNGGAPYSIPRR